MMSEDNRSRNAPGSALPAACIGDDPSLVTAVTAKLTALEYMDLAALRNEWRRLYRASPPKHGARQLLLLGVGWKIQEQAFGGLRGATKRTLSELTASLARDGDIARRRVTRLKPGARLIREWHGKIHSVIVLEDGFEWQGKHWRSLSVIARTISGMQWSGPKFFGLIPGKKSGSRSVGEASA